MNAPFSVGLPMYLVTTRTHSWPMVEHPSGKFVCMYSRESLAQRCIEVAGGGELFAIDDVNQLEYVVEEFQSHGVAGVCFDVVPGDDHGGDLPACTLADLRAYCRTC